MAPSVGLATFADGCVVSTRLRRLIVQAATHELAADTCGELESACRSEATRLIGREIASLKALAATIAAANASVLAAKAAFDATDARYRVGQLSFAEADAARDALVRVESARRRLGIHGALALARLGVVLEIAAR